MKKIGYILGLITIILIVSSICFAASFSDTKSTKFEEAVEVLTRLEIVNGYEDGTYRPNNDVTRAEMAKLIIVALGKDSVANSLKGKTQFSDVVDGGWASGYINCAVSQSIIKGYPDGSFKPNNKVTYAEAATMLLRALNYTKELEDESYPTGYMTVANNAGLLKNVQATKSSDNATRGYVANMIFNTLKASTRKIVSTTSTGKVNYGDGLSLVETSFDNMKCVKDGEVIDIDFEEGEVVVRDKTNDRKITLLVEDEKEIRSLFNRRVDVIYDNKEKEILSIEFVDSYTVKEIEIESIKKDTIYDKKENEYELPGEDDVLLQYITNYDEAETAYITYDGKKIICVVLEGTPKVYGGICTDADMTISKAKAIEVLDVDEKYHEYVLANSSSKVKYGEVLLYSINNDEEIVIRDRITVNDAGIVQDLKDDSLKVKIEKKTKEMPAKSEFYVFIVSSDGKTIKEGKLSDIEKEFDEVYLTSISEVYYIVVFEDSVDADDIVSTLSVSEARDQLEDTIAAAKKKIKKESSYSVETFVPFQKAYEDAVDAFEGTSSAAKLEILNRKLKQTMDALKSSNKEDKTLRNAYDDLQDAIKEAESKKQSDYTADSYKVLSTELKNAKAVSLDNTTLAKIETRTDALEKAINMLVTVAAQNEIESYISELKTLISTAETKIKSQSDYTTDSINDLKTALANAKKLNTSTASLAEIKNQVSNLEATIEALVLKTVGNYESLRKTLKKNYDAIMAISNSDGTYTKESYSSFVTQRDQIYKTYSALPSVSEVSKMSASQVSSETTKVNNLNTKISNAKKLLVSSKLAARLESLKTLIEKGEAIKEADWTGSITYSAFKTKLTTYKKYLTDSSKTVDDISNAILDLSDYIS